MDIVAFSVCQNFLNSTGAAGETGYDLGSLEPLFEGDGGFTSFLAADDVDFERAVADFFLEARIEVSVDC